MRVARWSSRNSSSSTSGCVLALLEVADHLELAVEQRLVASGQVDQQLRHRVPPVGVGLGQAPEEREVAVLLVLCVLPQDDLGDAGRQHGGAVNHRPGPRAVLPGGVVEDQLAAQAAADAVGQHGEHHVPDERHPVLVEGDEADEDEEVEVGLDHPAREVDEHGRAVDEARGDEERGQAAVDGQAGECHARAREHELERHVRDAVAPHHAHHEQRGHVQAEHPAQEQVAALEGRLVERVAPGEVAPQAGQRALGRARPAAVAASRCVRGCGRGVAGTVAAARSSQRARAHPI